MTALRPHQIHAPSLHILLGLRPVPLSVQQQCNSMENSIQARASELLYGVQLAKKRKSGEVEDNKNKGHRRFTDTELSILRKKILEVLEEGITDKKIIYATIEADEENDKAIYLPRNEHDVKMSLSTFEIYASATRSFFEDPIPSEQERIIMDYFKSGDRISKICKKLDLKEYAVKYTLIKFGISSRNKWPAKSFKKQIIELLSQGKTARQIQEAIGCDISSIYRTIKGVTNGISE